MTEQIRRDEILRGLECVVKGNGIGNCNGCKYLNEPHHNEAIMRDTFALLKAQEPRVMTLEEADKAPYVWLESDQGGLGVRRVEIDPEDSRTVYVMSFGLRTTIHEVRTFKRHFRCWSEKPSDELLKETPWTQLNGL